MSAHQGYHYYFLPHGICVPSLSITDTNYVGWRDYTHSEKQNIIASHTTRREWSPRISWLKFASTKSRSASWCSSRWPSVRLSVRMDRQMALNLSSISWSLNEYIQLCGPSRADIFRAPAPLLLLSGGRCPVSPNFRPGLLCWLLLLLFTRESWASPPALLVASSILRVENRHVRTRPSFTPDWRRPTPWGPAHVVREGSVHTAQTRSPGLREMARDEDNNLMNQELWLFPCHHSSSTQLYSWEFLLCRTRSYLRAARREKKERKSRRPNKH